ncbi:hypothetical protein GW17_00018232 [Ensete ventricosum]|nr:hypothetical protein GW17_00018232 [Ensete ventricosum]
MEEELSAPAPGCQKDFLRRFGAGGGEQGEKRTPWGDGGSGETELSLGLSLGGRVGLEPKEKRLVRPSSFSKFPTERDLSVHPPLARTCSLQAEAEVEHRRSKEVQGLKRLEAKRPRSEKPSSKAGTLGRKNNIFDKEFSRLRNGVVLHRPPAWADTAGRVVASKRFRLASPVSIGSEGSSCSSLYDIDSQPNQELELRSGERLQLGSAVDSYKKVGSRCDPSDGQVSLVVDFTIPPLRRSTGASIVIVTRYLYLRSLLHLLLTIPSYFVAAFMVLAVGRTTVDPPMLVPGRPQSRLVGHVIGPAVRGCRDVVAKSTFIISPSNV